MYACVFGNISSSFFFCIAASLLARKAVNIMPIGVGLGRGAFCYMALVWIAGIDLRGQGGN